MMTEGFSEKNDSERESKRFYEQLGLPENEKRLYETVFFVKSNIDRFSEELIAKLPEHQHGFTFKDLTEQMKVCWPEFTNERSPSIPDFSLPETMTDGKKVTMRFARSSGAHAARFEDDIDIKLPFSELMKAASEKDIREASIALLQTVFHEVEHIEFEGTEPDDDTREEAVRYLANDGEVRAYAKQYAFLFSQVFPGESFSPEKMQEIIAMNKSGEHKMIPADKMNTAENYFTRFAMAEKQEQYKDIADLKPVYHSLITLSGKFVEEMKILNR